MQMPHPPMPLVRIPAAFDHADWLFERSTTASARSPSSTGISVGCVSRRGHEFTKFTVLAEELAHTVRARHAVLDGEIVCLGADGRSQFYPLLFRREWPSFAAFDLLEIDGDNLRAQPLLERKRRLRTLVPRQTPDCSTSITCGAAVSICFGRSARETPKASSRSGRAVGTRPTAARRPG